MKYWTFEVEGKRGWFPFDMLRYDGAHPIDGHSVDAISDGHGTGAQDRVTIRLGRYGVNEPTIGRWNSFGWLVRNVQKHSIR